MRELRSHIFLESVLSVTLIQIYARYFCQFTRSCSCTMLSWSVELYLFELCIPTPSFTNWILPLYYGEKLVSVNQVVLCYTYLHMLHCAVWWSKCTTTNSRVWNHTICSLISWRCSLVKRRISGPNHIISREICSRPNW